MLRVRALLVFAATVAVIAVSEAQFGQPPVFTAPQPSPLAVALLTGIDDPAVVAELKLSEQQVKKLVARRQEVWDETYITAPSKFADGTAVRTEATDAFLKKTLTEAQYKRAAQLAGQSVLRRGLDADRKPSLNLTQVPAATLVRYPELATAFKLTDTQKKQLPAGVAGKGFSKGVKGDPGGGFGGGFGGEPVIVMTTDQAASAREFLGPLFGKLWVIKTDQRLTGRPAAPREIALFAARDVRADVKATDEQAKEFAALRTKWTQLTKDRRAEVSPKEAHEQATALKAESEKALTGNLKPEQLTRLKQIAFQADHSGTHIEQLYRQAAVVQQLALGDTQVATLDEIRESYRTDAAKAFETAETFEATEKKVKALIATRQTKAEAVLTNDQAAKLKRLVGEPFTGRTTADSPFGDRPGDGSAANTAARRAATFGMYSTTEFTYLANNKLIQDELKLTEQQQKQLIAERTVILAKFTLPRPSSTNIDAYAKAYAERSKGIEEAIGKILTAEQAKRFREIMLQALERPTTGFTPTGVNAAIAYPGVAEAVKLTDEQKKKLLAGTAPAGVLTDDQKTAIVKMLGDPFRGDITSRPGGIVPALPTTLRLFATGPSVLNPNPGEALKLTPEQVKQIAAAREAYTTVLRDTVGPGAGTDRDASIKALTAAIAEYEKSVSAILTADQNKRLPQLALQASAAANLQTALTSAETAKTLTLTAEQTTKLALLQSDAEQLQALLRQEGPGDQQLLPLRLRDAADARMLAVLTEPQRAKWKELTGEPWVGLRKAIPGRDRGPGGLGGGGNFGDPGGGTGGFGGFER